MVDRVRATVFQGEANPGAATIFLEDVRIATNVIDSQGQRALSTRASAEVASAVLGAGRTWHDRAFVVDDWQIAAYAPLTDARGVVVGMLYVGTPERPYVQRLWRYLALLLGIGLWGVAVAGVTAIRVANRISGPLAALDRAAQAVSKGDYRQQVPVDSPDELGRLAESFNRMTVDLERTHRELRTWGANLELKVAERTEELRTLGEQLAQSEKLASIGELSAGIAHEINNPNTFIRGNIAIVAEALQTLLPIADEAAKKDPNLRVARLPYADFRANIGTLVSDIASGADKIMHIVADLKKFARHDEGGLEEEVDLNAVVHASSRLVHNQVKRHAKVTLELRAGPAQGQGQLAAPGAGAGQPAHQRRAGHRGEEGDGRHPGGDSAAPRRPRRAERQGRRRRDDARGAAAHLRPVLHHQAPPARHGAGPVGELRHRQRARRHHRGRQRPWGGGRVPGAAPGAGVSDRGPSGNSGAVGGTAAGADVERILILDDDAAILSYLRVFFLQAGRHEVRTLQESPKVFAAIDEFRPDLLLLDIDMPELTGLDVLRALHSRPARPEVLAISGVEDVKQAVEAMKLGAYDYLTKPLEAEKLLVTVDRALERRSLKHQVETLKEKLTTGGEPHPFARIVTRSPKMLEVFRRIEMIAPTTNPVLVWGESGTGKELVARALHQLSPRRDRSFVAVNAGVFAAELFASEFFGHAKGAFTGAMSEKTGIIEQSDAGTLFLDEIGELSLPVQVKLLRVLQEGEYSRVGSTENRRVDVRLVTATNKDLREEIQKGSFRPDLFYRLNVCSIYLPPLRERGDDDVDLLSQYFLERYAKQHGKKVATISEDVRALLRRYPFPGNVRELENLVNSAVLLEQGPELDALVVAAVLPGGDAREGARAGRAAGGLRGRGGLVAGADGGRPRRARAALRQRQPHRRRAALGHLAGDPAREDPRLQAGVRRRSPAPPSPPSFGWVGVRPLPCSRWSALFNPTARRRASARGRGSCHKVAAYL
ncbi:MAG: sigma 54-interacting transcriptional regulator [Myxococcales bacterium]